MSYENYRLKIKRGAEPEKVSFGDLTEGEVFVGPVKELFIKTGHLNDYNDNSVSLLNGVAVSFEENDYVFPIKATLTYEYGSN